MCAKTSRQPKVARPQLFCIGWPKSGTNSLSAALQALDFRVLHTGSYLYHNPDDKRPHKIEENFRAGLADPFEDLDEWLAQFDAIIDWPTHAIWRQLLQVDAAAKFVVTYSSPNEIALSCVRHNWRNRLKDKPAVFNDDYVTLVKKIESHYSDVFAAALEHPKRFLLLAQKDSCAHKWRALCEFTNRDATKIKVAKNLPPWPREFQHEDEIFLPAKSDATVESLNADNKLRPVNRESFQKKPARQHAETPGFYFGDNEFTPYSASIRDDNFAVITCHWNPANWQSLRRNYQRFLYEMAWWRVPVFSAEIAYEGQTWASEATTFKIQGSARNLLWQKERLLNYIVEQLPAQYTKIAWIDADAIFLDPFWIEKTKTVLDTYPLVQLWDKWYSAGGRGELSDALTSVGHLGRRYLNKKTWSPGGAWAGVRSVFPLYDGHVVGSGDALCIEGWLGSNYAQTLHCMTPAMKNHFSQWALRTYAKTQGRVTAMLFDALHMYHGARENRLYYERSQNIISSNFDPAKHVRVEANGLFAWTEEAPVELVSYLQRYFTSRREDDAELPQSAH